MLAGRATQLTTLRQSQIGAQGLAVAELSLQGDVANIFDCNDFLSVN
jgi:hypothetical protein